MLGQQDRWQDELFIAVSLRDLIPEDHLLRRVDRVLDLSWLREALADCYCLDNGRPGIDPEAAVRLMLAGFLYGIVEDRHLLREAQVNLAIRWFAGFRLEERLPDHSSLTRLRARWGPVRFRRLFEQVVQTCDRAGLVAGDVLHVDATLVRADVSLSSLARVHAERVVAEHGEVLLPGPARKTRKARCTSRTDPDCGMGTSRRGVFTEPTYKGHVAVDDRAGVVVDIAVTAGDVNEGNLIAGQVAQVEALLGRSAATVTADAGYAYGKVYAALAQRGVNPLIPPKAEPPPGHVIPLKRFKYDARHEIVRCPTGKRLSRGSHAWHGWYYTARTADCQACTLKSHCLSPAVKRRTVAISDGYASLLRARRHRGRWSVDERRLYRRHRWRSEGINAEAKRRHGFGRAVRRGLRNMQIQAYLTATVINLKRLAA